MHSTAVHCIAPEWREGSVDEVAKHAATVVEQ